MGAVLRDGVGEALRRGLVIPACPLALTEAGAFDERRQRALVRYYAAAGAGGLAVGVHTTQFEIREGSINLLEPVLRVAREELVAAERRASKPLVAIGGICGDTPQALMEADLLVGMGYDAGLLSLAALREADDDTLIEHCRAVADVIPIVGFYLQPAVGGRVLPYSFWRRFAEIEPVVAIKIAPFNRYQTIDVVRAVVCAGRDDIALYTGNDDNIILDLLTPFRFTVDGAHVERRFVGGLLGHWAVWTRRAVEHLERCHDLVAQGGPVPLDMLRLAHEVTDANAAIFDAANGFAGCIIGIHEILRRQGLLESTRILDTSAGLHPCQAAEIDRVCSVYSHLTDDAFVAERLEGFLAG